MRTFNVVPIYPTNQTMYRDFIENDNALEVISDKDVILQEVALVLSTSKGECFWNPSYGINRMAILGKNVKDIIIESEILEGIRQVDSTFSFLSFTIERDDLSRNTKVAFTAKNDTGVEITSGVIL